jgi:Flp pilus assembly pilin Flp
MAVEPGRRLTGAGPVHFPAISGNGKDFAVHAIGRFLTTVHCDETGQDMAEYGLIAALISVAAVAALLLIEDPLLALWDLVLAALALVP